MDKKLYAKIVNFVYPQLRDNLEGYYRYRIGNYRLFYLVEDDKLIIAVVDFKHRQQAYD